MADANQTLIETKAKLLDAIEANQAMHQHNQQLSQALQSISQLLGLQPDETGNLELETIVAAVADLVPTDDALNDENDGPAE